MRRTSLLSGAAAALLVASSMHAPLRRPMLEGQRPEPIRNDVPRVRGKSARRAEKRARRLERADQFPPSGGAHG
ncbi:hypothetical protein [Pseudorhodoferax sp. Leaf265]|uniref:hypothetical protein n=1 Tax=Pseudorhodoferax sp. Leaf265 TaxID=1736315 RepID=UPI0012E894F8|nr:hypothetical protein [Pseudorhodoferax sp. Leaf265]